MWRAFPTSDYYGSSASRWGIGVVPPWHPQPTFPVSPLRTRTCRVGCPSHPLSSRSANRLEAAGLTVVRSAVPGVTHSHPHALGSRQLLPPTSLPTRPDRSRRPWQSFSPQGRINGFMFFNLPALSLGGLLGVGDLASTPVVSGLRHPTGTPQVTAAQTLPPSRTTASDDLALHGQGRRYFGTTHGPFSHPARHGLRAHRTRPSTRSKTRATSSSTTGVTASATCRARWQG